MENKGNTPTQDESRFYESGYESELTNEDIQKFRDTLASDTLTLTSSVFDYQYENGRRYHAFRQGKYICPNDEQQSSSIDIFHHVCTLLLAGELFRAPIGENPERILDIGTGTGIWAVEVADQFPNAQVTGTDLSPIQPQWVPPNVSFELDDCESEWTFPPDHFDFIHIRCIFGGVKDWPRLIAQAYTALKPGGWIEVIETEIPSQSDDGTLNDSTTWYKWERLVIGAAAKALRPMVVAKYLSQWLFDAGFEQIDDLPLKTPLGGSWCSDPVEREVGRWNAVSMMEGIEGFTMGLLHRVFGWSPIEVQALIGQVRTEWLEQKVHGYFNTRFVIGQKPLVPRNIARPASSHITPTVEH